jgi:hypothetical protein
MRDGGKGDTPRPLSVDMKVFDMNFDRIFGKKKEKQDAELPEMRSQTKDNTNSNGNSTS